ncbi:hypothetical protein [Chromobacterium sp.]|uniref:hypothetical protein n=1 Tax=Chromobacterium sp. TaxID=306190 RepID=UPI0035B1700A
MRHTQYLFGLSGLALPAPGFASPGNLGKLVEIFIFIALVLLLIWLAVLVLVVRHQIKRGKPWGVIALTASLLLIVPPLCIFLSAL